MVLNGVYVDSEKNIYVRQGDSGTITLTGIPTDENYKLSLGVFNPLNQEIVAETSSQSNSMATASLTISAAMTNSLPSGKYFYAIKLSSGANEQTVLPQPIIDSDNNVTMVNAPFFYVRPKLVEGAE